jgi:hypothetical protein
MHRITSLTYSLAATLVSLVLVLGALAEPLSAWASGGNPGGM